MVCVVAATATVVVMVEIHFILSLVHSHEYTAGAAVEAAVEAAVGGRARRSEFSMDFKYSNRVFLHAIFHL